MNYISQGVTEIDKFWLSKLSTGLILAAVVVATLQTTNVYYKSFKVEKFCNFRRSIGDCSEIACAISLGHTRLLSNSECFPANYSLVLQPRNFFTLNDLQYKVILPRWVQLHWCCYDRVMTPPIEPLLIIITLYVVVNNCTRSGDILWSSSKPLQCNYGNYWHHYGNTASPDSITITITFYSLQQ